MTEQFWIDFLLNAPAWVILLVIGSLLFRQLSKAEEKREENRAADEKMRNGQMMLMIEHGANTVVAINGLRDVTVESEKIRTEQLARLESTQASISAALELLKRGWEDNTTALTALSEMMQIRFGETIRIGKDTQEAAREAANNGKALYALLQKIDTSQDTILASLNQLLKRGLSAEAVAALSEEIASLKAIVLQIEQRLPPTTIIQ